MGHLICDKMYVSLWWRVVLTARAQIQMDQSELTMKPRGEGPLSHASSQAFDESRQVFGMKFIGLYGTVIFIAIRDFSFGRGSDL